MSDDSKSLQIVPAHTALPARAYGSLPPAVLGPDASAEPAIQLRELIDLLLRRWRVVALCSALAFGAALLYTSTAPRVYEAQATFLVSQSRPAREAAPEEQLPSMAAAISAPALETHAALLMGEATARTTAAWLKAHGGPSLTPAGVRGSISTSIVERAQLVRLRVRAGTPERAERIAGAIAESHVETTRRLAQSSSENAGKQLAKQLSAAKDRLAEAELALWSFREKTGTVADDAEAAKFATRAATWTGREPTSCRPAGVSPTCVPSSPSRTGGSAGARCATTVWSSNCEPASSTSRGSG